MPSVRVETKHEEYEKRLPQWTRQRDAMEGEDAIKAKGTQYLPKLEGQSGGAFSGLPEADDDRRSAPVSDYEAYKGRASFINATSRTVEALSGFVLKKPPALEWPEAKKTDLRFMGRRNQSLEELRDKALSETIGIGRFGHLVDAPTQGTNPPFGIKEPRPYVSEYQAESITYWEEEVVGDRLLPTYVTLLETKKVLDGEKYVDEIYYRVLILGEPLPFTDEEVKLGRDGFLRNVGILQSDLLLGPVYFQEIWTKQVNVDPKDKKETYIRTEIIVPKIKGGALLREMPFTFFNPNGTSACPCKPPILDVTVINISLYKNSADMEHGLHFTALPQAWVSGFRYKGDLTIGSGCAWVAEEPGANAGYLEFTGQGLGTLDKAMDRKMKAMAAAGARVLEDQSSAGAAESTDTVRERKSGEGSALSRIANNVSEALTRTLRFYALFLGFSPEQADKVTIRLNTDFSTYTIDGPKLIAIMSAVQQGLISWNTGFYNLQKGGIIPDGITEEQEAVRIAAGVPEKPMTDAERALNEAANKVAAADQAAADAKAKDDETSDDDAETG